MHLCPCLSTADLVIPAALNRRRPFCLLPTGLNLGAGDEEQFLLEEEFGEARDPATAPPAAAATQLDEEEEERRLLALAADDDKDGAGQPSQGAMLAGARALTASLPGPVAPGVVADTALGSEDRALLEELDAQLLPSQHGGDGNAGGVCTAGTATAGAVHRSQMQREQERQQALPQASPLLGADTEEQPAVWPTAEEPGAGDAGETRAQRAAPVMEPSLELGDCTEEQAAFEPSPLLGECTEEQLPPGSRPLFVPETEQQTGTQEL